MTEQSSTNHVIEKTSSQVRTFLIADVRGYTRFTVEEGDEAAAKLASRFGEIASEVVQSREGLVIELRGDEALAVFTSARQALRASIDLQDRFSAESRESSLPFKVGIGLDSGEAIPVGGGYRGTALNLAARLCALAGAGEVLASDTVANLARKIEGVTYAERGSVQLKGFIDDVCVMEVRASSVDTSLSELSESTPKVSRVRERPLPIGGFLGALPGGVLVSREEELGKIFSAVDVVAGGTGRLVLLPGEPGAGKTRIAQEVTLNVRNRGFLLATGICYEPRQSVPYYPFLDVLASLYESSSPSLRSVIGERWPYLAWLLPEAGISAPSTSDAQEEQERLFRAIAGFVQAMADESPIAILLDDLHWADSSSLDLLQRLARQTRAYRVLLLGTYRDVEVGRQHPLERALLDLKRQGLVEVVPVRRLGQGGTAALVAQSFGQEQISTEFADLVHRRTEGNPFFTQEVLQALVERGDIYRENGHWERREIATIEVPESVRSTIGERLSRLKEAAQEVLREGSVLGQTFAFDDLKVMGNHEEKELEEALDEAMSAGLIRETGHDAYAFNHALTQQVLYEELSARKKRRLHQVAGEALERLLPQRVQEERVGELARHFLQADELERALPYEVVAGDQAEAVFAHGEAEQHYRTALKVVENLPAEASPHQMTKAEVLVKLGTLLKITGRYDEALEMLEMAAQIYGDADDPEGTAKVMAQIGLVYGLRASPEDGIARLRPMVDSLDEGQTSYSLAVLYAALVRLYTLAGWSEQLATSQRLLELAGALEDERLLVQAELHRGISLHHAGQLDAALDMLEAAIPRAERVGDFSTVCMALDVAAHIYHGRQQLDRAMKYHERAVEVAERLGDPKEISYRTLEIAYVAFLLGDWGRSRDCAERSLKAALSLDTLATYFQPLYTLGELSLYQGEWEDAAGYLRECCIVSEHTRNAETIREVQGLLAEQDLMRGQPEAALARLQALLDNPDWKNHVNFLLALASVYLEVGNTTGAEDAAAKAMAEASRLRIPVAQVETLRIQGMNAIRQDRPDKAQECFDSAVKRAAELRYPWGEARALYQRALMRSQTGDVEQARDELNRARALFESLGARPYAAQAEEALQRL